MEKYSEVGYVINTGDILLFDERPEGCLWGFLDRCIKCCTNSKYSHSALALRNPSWLGLPDGLYVWESTAFTGNKDAKDGDVKFGVQIQHFDEYTKKYKGNAHIYVRSAMPRAQQRFTEDFLKAVYHDVHNKPYDLWPQDWLDVILRIGPKKTTDRFWCSAFVSYILTRAQILDRRTDWSEMTPQDLSVNGERIHWQLPYLPDIKIL